MGRDFPRVVGSGIGESDDSATLAIRDRLTGAYKHLHAHAPESLNAYAVLLSAMQECLAGSLRPVCLSLGMSDKQYQHISEGLNGDGISGANLIALLIARPACVAPAFAAMFETLGYSLTPKQPTHTKLTAHETGAALSEKVGHLQAETIRALSDGKFDETEGRIVRGCIEATEGVLRELKAHAEKVGRK